MADRSVPSSLLLLRRQIGYQNRLFRRTPIAAFFTLVFPLIFLVLFGALFDGIDVAPGLEVDAEGVETNMLFIGTGERDAAALAKRLDESGIRLLATGPHTLRAVTNLTVSAGEIVQVITAFEELP